MPRYFQYLTVLLFVTIGAWGFGSRRTTQNQSEDHSLAASREPASDYHEHPVDSSGGGRGLAVLDAEQVANAIAAEMRALGVTEQRHLGEHPACNDDNDTACLMGLSPADRLSPTPSTH